MLVTFILLIIILLVIVLYKKKLEKFKVAGSISNYTYSTFPDNNSSWNKNTKFIKSPSINDTDISSDINATYIVDQYDLDKYKNNSKNIVKEISEGPDGYFVIIVDINKVSNNHCSFNCSFDLQTKTIGYYDNTDLYFIYSLIYSYRQDVNSIKLVKLTYNTNVKLELSNIDTIITYIIPDSNFHKWIVMQDVALYGFNHIDLNRLALYYPYLTPKQVSKDEFKKVFLPITEVNPHIIIKEDNTLLLSTRLKLIKIKIVEDFVSRLQINQEALDPDYKCYGNEGNQSRVLCNSKYDIYGKLRTDWTVWDRPCKKNEDCPFYNLNKNYPNDRGGCLVKEGGMCELPIGVKRKGYTKYDDKNEYTPFCYGCPPDDLKCCASQNNPDYAFKNDKKDRLKYGLNTSIDINPIS